MTSYIPISCDFYDYLEAFATVRKQVVIKFYEDGQLTVMSTKIRDLYCKEKVEYLITDQDSTIRLDQIAEVNGVAPHPSGNAG